MSTGECPEVIGVGQVFEVLKGHTMSVVSVAISPDGAKIVSGSGDTSIRVWSTKTGEVRYACAWFDVCVIHFAHAKWPQLSKLENRLVHRNA